MVGEYEVLLRRQWRDVQWEAARGVPQAPGLDSGPTQSPLKLRVISDHGGAVPFRPGRVARAG